MSMDEKPFGFECTYERRVSMAMTEEAQFHGRGSEAKIRARARWKTGFVRIVRVTPYTKQGYITAFGEPNSYLTRFN